jgi:hypothetical protein
VLVRRGLALLTLLALAGCSGGPHPGPRPTQTPTLVIPKPSPTGKPRPARAGTVCGPITTVTGAHARVVVVRGVTTCAEALRVFGKYNDPATPAEGTAGLAVIDHWTCETRGTVTTCVRKAVTIESRR